MSIGDVMATSNVATGDKIIDPMIALANCSTRDRILVAGSKSIEMMIELHRRGYVEAASSGTNTISHWSIGDGGAFPIWRRR